MNRGPTKIGHVPCLKATEVRAVEFSQIKGKIFPFVFCVMTGFGTIVAATEGQRCPDIISGVSGAFDFSPNTRQLDQVLYDYIQEKLASLSSEEKSKVLRYFRFIRNGHSRNDAQTFHGRQFLGIITVRDSLFKHPFARSVFIHELQHLINYVLKSYGRLDRVLNDERSAVTTEYRFIRRAFDKTSLLEAFHFFSGNDVLSENYLQDLELLSRFSKVFELSENEYVKRFAETKFYIEKNERANAEEFRDIQRFQENFPPTYHIYENPKATTDQILLMFEISADKAKRTTGEK